MNLMNASNQWANRPSDQRFTSLSELRDAVHSRRLRTRSRDIDLNQIHVKADGNDLVVNSAISAVRPTHWGFSQLSGWAGAPAGYLRKLPVELAAQCLNDGIRKSERETLKFMTLSNPEGLGDLAAVTSQSYGRIWDADVTDAAGRIVERSNGKFHNPLAYDLHTGVPKPSGLYASDHDVFVFMIDGGSILEAGPRAKLNRGFFMWNSEVGARSFGLMTFLFNTVCGNHIVWGAQQVNKLIIRHTQGGPYRFDSEAFPALMEYTGRTETPELDAIKRAQTLSLRSMASDSTIGAWEKRDAELGSFLKRKGLTFTSSELREAIDCAEREEGQCASLWDLVQGLTAYARGFDFIDTRVDLEKRAGDLLKLAA